MKLNLNTYRDKVYACWLGKNIGGTIGTPYEGLRQIHDIKGFATAPNVVLPNDDLDLQLIWLHAVEHEGIQAITSEVLGEYWLSYITPYWNEYGIGKRNMQAGILPPLCGDVGNNWKHSNGAWIRTEIWASLAPAAPDIALRYAMEDAKVDHGSGEGTIAAAFVAALESAAFVISDIRKLIDIGLSKIPADSRVARTIRLLLDLYDSGKTWLESRNAVFEENADIGDGWFEAPTNVAYAIIGLLYGEGDFKKTVLTAVNCGDDTDCTGATAGAILGIMNGTKGIPEDWKKHIGDDILTCSINLGLFWPKITSCTELTDRVVRLAPSVLVVNRTDVELTDGEGDTADDETYRKMTAPFALDEQMADEQTYTLLSLQPDTIAKRFAFATAFITYENGVEISQGEERKLSIQLLNNVKAYGNKPYTVNVKVWLPEGFSADRTDFDIYLPHHTPKTSDCLSKKVELKITANDDVCGINEVLLEMSVQGRYTRAYIPVKFLDRNGSSL